jgi:hypothetical protein
MKEIGLLEQHHRGEMASTFTQPPTILYILSLSTDTRIATYYRTHDMQRQPQRFQQFNHTHTVFFLGFLIPPGRHTAIFGTSVFVLCSLYKFGGWTYTFIIAFSLPVSGCKIPI